jgi:hypothetical protein
MEIAIVEPHFHLVHGGTRSLDKYMVVYSYSTNQFYNNEWQEEFIFCHKHLVKKLNDFHHIEHDLIRNYRELIKKRKLFQLHIVKIIEDERHNQTCILYTYRINIFKRIWRKKHQGPTMLINVIIEI